MESFSLDLKKLGENIDSYKKLKSKCVSDYKYCYNVLNGVDSAWNDQNTIIFKNRLKSNNKMVDNIFSNCDEFYNNLNNLKSRLRRLFDNFGYRNIEIRKVIYDNSYLKSIDNRIDNAIYYISKAVDEILEIVYPSDFEKLELVNKDLNILINLKNNLSVHKTNIHILSDAILNIVNDAKISSNRTARKDTKLKTLDFNWTNVYGDFGKNKTAMDDNLPSTSIKTGKISTNMETTYTGTITTNVGLNVKDENEININNDKTSKNLTNNLYEFDKSEEKLLNGEIYTTDNITNGAEVFKKTEENIDSLNSVRKETFDKDDVIDDVQYSKISTDDTLGSHDSISSNINVEKSVSDDAFSGFEAKGTVSGLTDGVAEEESVSGDAFSGFEAKGTVSGLTDGVSKEENLSGGAFSGFEAKGTVSGLTDGVTKEENLSGGAFSGFEAKGTVSGLTDGVTKEENLSGGAFSGFEAKGTVSGLTDGVTKETLDKF